VPPAVEKTPPTTRQPVGTPQETPDLFGPNATLLLEGRVHGLRDPAKALERAKRAAALARHGRPDMLFVLSKAYTANGQTNQAIETLEHALSLLAPGDSPLRQDIEAILGSIRLRLRGRANRDLTPRLTSETLVRSPPKLAQRLRSAFAQTSSIHNSWLPLRRERKRRQPRFSQRGAGSCPFTQRRLR